MVTHLNQNIAGTKRHIWQQQEGACKEAVEKKNASFIYHFTDSFILHITEFSVAATAALVYRGAVVRTCHQYV